MSDHDRPPKTVESVPDEVSAWLEGMRASPYVASVRPLEGLVQGRTVRSTRADSSGFMLRFEDGSWVICFLDGEVLRWRQGTGEPMRGDLALMASSIYGDAQSPLSANLPHADESCDVGAEVAKAQGQPVVGLAYGERCFNFCFPDGRELETMIVPTAQDRPGLRVFWEQW